MNMNKKKSLILTVVGIIGIVLITVGVTYAFYNYADQDGSVKAHNDWYNDLSTFLSSSYPWFIRGGVDNLGVIAGQFNFTVYTGYVEGSISSRLVLAL